MKGIAKGCLYSAQAGRDARWTEEDETVMGKKKYEELVEYRYKKLRCFPEREYFYWFVQLQRFVGSRL